MVCFAKWKSAVKASAAHAHKRKMTSVDRQVSHRQHLPSIDLAVCRSPFPLIPFKIGELEKQLQEQLRHQHEDIKNLDEEIRRVESVLGLKQKELTEHANGQWDALHGKHEELDGKHDELDGKHGELLDHVNKPMVLPEPVRPGVEFLEKNMRNVARRWQMREASAIFNGFVAEARKSKRRRYILTKAVLRMGHLVRGRAWRCWRERVVAQRRARNLATKVRKPAAR